MKRFLLSILILGISASSIFAQHDVKVNAFGLFFKDIGVGYEYLINDQMSTGVFINSISGTPFLDLDEFFDGRDDYKYYGFKITPEFRFYTSPNFGADKRYIGAYLRYSYEKYSDLDYQIDDFLTGESTTVPYTYQNNSLVLGLTTGVKWVFNSGVYIESLWGLGRKISTSPKFSTEEAEKHIIEYYGGIDNYSFTTQWDVRLQLSIGYRIGGY